jgi:Protein of unknown function (DUF3606).
MAPEMGDKAARVNVDADVAIDGNNLNRAAFQHHDQQEVCFMSTTTRGRAQDRARVAGGQEHEVRYEAKKEGVSKDAVRKSVKAVGNSRNKVEADLERKH